MRELELEVAVKVMGWKFDSEIGAWESPDPALVSYAYPSAAVPSYATSIHDAMDVLCKARAGKQFVIVGSEDDPNDYFCDIGEGEAMGHGATISEAICRAALAKATSTEPSPVEGEG